MVMKYDLIATLFYVAIANADLTYRIMGQRTLSDYFMTMAALQTHWLDAPDEVTLPYLTTNSPLLNTLTTN